MKPVTLTIDGKKITANAGEKLLWVALENDIYIPNLCAIKERPEPHASCRLCFVEIEGMKGPVTACTTDVSEGMVVNTKGEKALSLARAGFELLMASHTLDCAHCSANGKCELQKIAKHLKASLKTKRLRLLLRDLPVDDSNPLFTYDPNKCVLCGRCVWVCRQDVKSGVFGFAHRGFDRVMTTFGDEPIGKDQCLDCHKCIDVCPTGALAFKDKTG
ncbi:MAG: (2Fe-2S)-binding protein [Dehalococcoidales bacterium]|nr:(2Fe-2S)-binding protein [Dehalococcoidales bacterium]